MTHVPFRLRAGSLAILLSLFAAGARGQTLPLAPYEEVTPWGPAVAGSLEWEPAGLDVDARGTLYLLRRSDPALLIISPAGTVQKTFANLLFVWAHGIHVDRGGHIWATDCTVGSPTSTDLLPVNAAAIKAGRGHQVYKFSPDGALLLTLGTAGEAGGGPDRFNCPTDVVTAPDGTIFVSDGHDGMANARIVKFGADGRFLKAWGSRGAGPGELSGPHALAMDSRGRVLVADRGNKRIQVFDQDGVVLEQFTEFGGPAGMALMADDTLFVTDSQKKHVLVGSARTGKVTGVIPNIYSEPIAVDAEGTLYIGEVHPHTLRKFRLKR